MALTPGTRLGVYEITTQIGEGGMGQVYRGTDTTLGRQVAIKVLPEAFAADPERVARFEREAKTLASLNHPNIAAVYGFEKSGGTHALVMELVEGDDLSQRIARGAVPLDEALPIATQIAEALDAAHEQGIIHRDLKPANVKVRADGTVKVLDFGLAKAMEPAAALRVSAGQADGMTPTMMPTITTPAMTQAGMILGTAAYMSPEQARGKVVDKRADIWAFGAVLFEMLTARRAFVGDDITDTIVSVISKEPDWSALPAATPVSVTSLLQRCVTKDPRRRLRDIGEARMALEGAAEEPPGMGAREAPQTVRQRPFWALAAVAVLAAVLGGAAVWVLGPSASGVNAQLARLTMALPSGDAVALRSPDGETLALSPDGTTLVYVGLHDGQQQLFLRSLDGVDVKAISGTEGAATPFFSPDGQWIAFFAAGKLKKVAVAGGGAQALADASQARGGAWGLDDSIYFAPTANTQLGIMRVAASGGTVSEVTTLDRSTGEVSHRWPRILPGGKALLLTVWEGPGADEKRIEALILQTGERRVLVRGAESGRYMSTGHLVYADGASDTLMAVPMNLDLVQVSGAPVVLADRIRSGSEGAHFAVSDAGHLAYVRGSEQRQNRRLVWVDGRGNVEVVPAPTRPYISVALSPDGRLAALEAGSGDIAIFIYDFARQALTKLNTGGSSQAPVWSPDGTRVVYRATRAGSRNLFWKAVDNVGPEERLTTSAGTQAPASFSPDGGLLAFAESAGATGADLWVLPMPTAGNREAVAGSAARRLLDAPADQRAPQVSPDGRWLAYASSESGRLEVYVQPFPGMERKWSISTSGGSEPRWARNGRTLFYRNDDKIMAVDVTTAPAFAAGSPRLLFQGRGLPTETNATAYDVSLDGQRFLMVEPVESQAAVTQIEIVMNWVEELKRLVPTK